VLGLALVAPVSLALHLHLSAVVAHGHTSRVLCQERLQQFLGGVGVLAGLAVVYLQGDPGPAVAGPGHRRLVPVRVEKGVGAIAPMPDPTRTDAPRKFYSH